MADFDKGLYQAPPGIEVAAMDEPMLEIEIEDPESVSVNGIELLKHGQPDQEEDFYRNLAETLAESVLQSIASDLKDEIDEDIRARRDWEKTYAEGINLLGLKYETRSEPWQGACGVFHPMITEAVIRFQADTMLETFPASGPVKTNIVGKITEDKEKAAKRVENDLNWQLTENMPEFRAEHERMLWSLPAVGCTFKKVYRCPILERQTSVYVAAEDVIIPYGTTNLITCERIAHRMRKTKLETAKLQESGFWRKMDLPEPSPQQQDVIEKKKDKETGITDPLDDRYMFFEVAVDLNLSSYAEGKDSKKPDGKARPYIVTLMDDGRTVVALRRNWKEDDKNKQKRLHFVQYTYIPGFGAYGFGLFHLLGGFAHSATSIMRQLVDAGTLSNLPGGLKSKGLRIKGDDEPISPGEFRDVDVGSGTIRDNILTLPYKEPSATLYNLLLNIVEEARRFAATNDIKVADLSSQAPVGTTLAVLERQLRTMTAVQARVHFSFKQELRLLADIIKEDAEEGGVYAYEVDAPQGNQAKLEDYSYVSIIPVSDPNAATMSQRVVQYQAAIQLAQMAPQIYDQPELHRQMLTVLGIKNIGKLVPTEADIKVVDPVQENQNMLVGKPVKSWAWQDHESHIRVHMAAMQDPLIQQLVGQNPQAQKIMGSMTSHISEHVGYAYRVKMQQAMGMSLPVLGKDDSLPEEIEIQLSKMLSQAAPIVMQQSQQLVSQQQADRNAQDPVMIAQMLEQVNAKEEIERKKRKDVTDAGLEQQKLQLEAQKAGIDPQTLQFEQGLEMFKAASQMSLEQEKIQHMKEKDAMKIASDMAKQRIQMTQEQQKKTQESERDKLKTTMEMASKHHERLMAGEKHRQEMKQKKEKHKADLAAKEKLTAAQVKAMKEPKTDEPK